MALIHVREVLREHPAGIPATSIAVQYRRLSDDSPIGSTATSDSSGVVQKNLATTTTTGTNSYELFPGPYYSEFDSGGGTHREKSSVSSGSTGAVNLIGQHFLNHAMGNGFIQEPPYFLEECAPTGDGVNRWVTVATGAFVILGMPNFNHLARQVAIAANASGLARIDTIVIEAVGPGEATEGMMTLKVLQGTPDASPVAPSLTQTDALFHLPICNVAVANGAAVINQGNITDRRDFVERAVSDVETDIGAVEDRLDNLEDVRLQLIGWHEETVNITGMAPLAGTEHVYTVSNRVTAFHNLTYDDEVVIVRHDGFDALPGLSIKGRTTSTTQVTVGYYNGYNAVVDPASGTLQIYVLRRASA